VALYFYDYLKSRLGWFKTWKIKKHIEHCINCQSDFEAFKHTIHILESERVQEPSPHFFTALPQQIMEQSKASFYAYSSSKKTRWWAAAAAVLVGITSGLVLLFSSQHYEWGQSVLWTFFNRDVWDLSSFFHKVDENKLITLAPAIEEKFKVILTKELRLTDQDESRLFPVLKDFSYTMKEYCYSYGTALAALTVAIEKEQPKELEQCLQDLHQIREKWSNSRWELLQRVRMILSKEQFARFLLFSERVPEELRNIYSELKQSKG